MSFIAEHAAQKLLVRPTASELGALLGLSVALGIHSAKALRFLIILQSRGV